MKFLSQMTVLAVCMIVIGSAVAAYAAFGPSLQPLPAQMPTAVRDVAGTDWSIVTIQNASAPSLISKLNTQHRAQKILQRAA